MPSADLVPKKPAHAMSIFREFARAVEVGPKVLTIAP